MLPYSGVMTYNMIAGELRRPGTVISSGDQDFRQLAGAPAGAPISLNSFYGKDTIGATPVMHTDYIEPALGNVYGVGFGGAKASYVMGISHWYPAYMKHLVWVHWYESQSRIGMSFHTDSPVSLGRYFIKTMQIGPAIMDTTHPDVFWLDAVGVGGWTSWYGRKNVFTNPWVMGTKNIVTITY